MTFTKTGGNRQVDISDKLFSELRNLKNQKKVEAIREGLYQPVEAIFHDRKVGTCHRTVYVMYGKKF